MSNLNRYEKRVKRTEYEANKNYDQDIFNVEAKLPEYRYNNFKKICKISTDISERRI
jgi:hypothetical protein